MAEVLQPSTQRPSTWPIRSYRRHAAAMEFNNLVLTALGNVSDRLSRMEHTLAKISVATPPGLGTSDCAESICDNGDNEAIIKLERRIHGMEALLFRARLDDFTFLDKIISNAQSCSETNCSPDSVDESEKEATPAQTDISNASIMFNIFDCSKDVCTQTEQTDGIILRFDKDASSQGVWEALDGARGADIVRVDQAPQVELPIGTKGKVYAVKGGPCPGVFTCWDEARKASRGHKGVRCKKFDDVLAAESYAMRG